MTGWKALPKPATPGPWHAEEGEYECGNYCSFNGCPGHGNGDFIVIPPWGEETENFTKEDAAAIAALPEYVEQNDDLKKENERLWAWLDWAGVWPEPGEWPEGSKS